jgi:Cys-tRNA(Pro)/Cys-tRNA(Cys) deacylase
MASRTPATRALERAGVSFALHAYDYDPDAGKIGLHAAQSLGVAANAMLKTLIVRVDGQPACVVLPSDREASMKKVAAAFAAKSAEMAKPTDAKRITGYRIGGVSPFGQKKQLATVIDASALAHPAVFVNGGQRGLQIELEPIHLVRALGAQTADIVQNGPPRN